MRPSTIVITMAKRGMLAAGRPSRTIRQLATLRTWGYGVAGELRQAAARSPEGVAVIDETRGAMTYTDLVTESERVAAVLQGRGFTAEDRIGLLARNHVGALAVMAACSSVGADVVLANTGMSAEQIALVIEQQGIAALIYDDDLAEAVTELPEHIVRISETEMAQEVAEYPAPSPLRPPERTGRTIILTSGTTGTPRGAARKTPGGLGPLISIIERIPLHVEDTILISAPIFHTWGFAASQLALALRATIVLQRRFDPAAARQALTDHGVQAMFAVPVMLQRMLELPSEPGKGAHPSLRVVATSGSAYPQGFAPRFMDEYGEVLYNLYGSTEASWVCIATPEDLRADSQTAGTPPVGTVVRIIDADGRPAPMGETGRIFCGNELVFDGYTSGQSKEFIDGMVSTGDMGYQREDGRYFIVGRDDDMVISGGENVYPMELESVLADHPAIREVAVVGVPDEEFGARLAAFIVLHEGEELTAGTVRDLARAHRARHVVPREVVFVDELPRNSTGKVLTRELRTHFP